MAMALLPFPRAEPVARRIEGQKPAPMPQI